MEINAFKPKIDEKHKFAVAVPASGIMAIIQTYSTREDLEEGYKKWHGYATQKGITKPCPIELLDENGTCKILEEILIDPLAN